MPEQIKSKVRRLVGAINAGGEAEAVDELFTPMAARRVKRLFAEFRSAFPDWREDIVELVAEENTVAGRFRCSGTHLGELLLREVRWASRVWALPFLSALAPSERYATETGQRHKSLTEWAWQLLMLVRRWYPERQIVAVADSTYASLKLLDRCRGSPIRSPSSPACAWTPPSTSQPHHAILVN